MDRGVSGGVDHRLGYLSLKLTLLFDRWEIVMWSVSKREILVARSIRCAQRVVRVISTRPLVEIAPKLGVMVVLNGHEGAVRFEFQLF